MASGPRNASQGGASARERADPHEQMEQQALGTGSVSDARRASTSSSATSVMVCAKTASDCRSLGQLAFADPELCRAAHLSDVLHRGGHLLRDCKGSAETYALSMPTARIHSFISHNWAVGRFQKFLMLSLHFNFWKACAAAFAFVLLGMLLNVTDVVPHDDRDNNFLACIGTTLTMVAFFIVLLCGHEMELLLCRRRGPRVFLDKVCIHQTDVLLQQQGIQALGAFMRHSSNFVVCYTDLYLRKLWTMYELATYLAIAAEDARSVNVHVISAWFPWLVIGSVVATWLGVLGRSAFLGSLGGTAALAQLGECFTLLVTTLGMVMMRAWAREQRKMQRYVLDFRAAEATCTEESDRAAVLQSIALFMRSGGSVDASAPDWEAIVAFEELVRSVVPDEIARASGRTGHRYTYWVPVALVTLSTYLSVDGHDSARGFALNVVASVTKSFATIPICGAAMAAMSRRFLGASGVCEAGYVLFSGLLAAAILFALDPALGPLIGANAASAERNDTAMARLLALCAADTVLTAFLYRRLPHRPPSAMRSVGVAVPPVHPGSPQVVIIGHHQDPAFEQVN